MPDPHSHHGPQSREMVVPFRWSLIAIAVIVAIGALGAALSAASHPHRRAVAALPDAPSTSAVVRPSPTASALPQATATVPTAALVASFNLYGCTESSPSWRSCTARFPDQWSYLQRYRVSIVGVQELEPSVFDLFRQQVGAPSSGWAMYPTRPNYVHQQTTGILWRTDQWTFVRGDEFDVVKYSWRDQSGLHSMNAHDAAVLLRSSTGQELWVISIHNMSGENTSFQSGLAQDEATEADEFGRRAATGIPVVLVGDFNDDTVGAICAVRSRTSAAHSIWDPIPAGGCANPGSTHGQSGDKIIGSGAVAFTASGIDWSLQQQKLTDHGIAWADLLIR